jgi:hypothetical protein
MKIAVYGNSFAEGPWSPEAVVPPAWFDHLAKLLNADVKTFGKGGTPMVYSYKKFLENHKDHDLNVFLVTHWQNYTKLPSVTYKDGSTEDNIKFNSLRNVESFLEENKDRLTDVSLEFINHVRGWFIAADDEYMKLTWELMMKHMETLDPKIVFISTCDLYTRETLPPWIAGTGDDFSWSDERRKNQLVTRGTMNYLRLQTESFGEQHKVLVKKNNGNMLTENSDRIACHFTKEINILFGEHVYRLVTDGEWPPLPKQVEHDQPVDYYYIT